MYYCYLITNEHNQCYTGITNDLNKRIKQHNGILKNGAKCTKKSKLWSYHTVIGVFETRSDVSSFEWYWKHVQNKNNSKWRKTSAGLRNRMQRLIDLLIYSWPDKKIMQINNIG